MKDNNIIDIHLFQTNPITTNMDSNNSVVSIVDKSYPEDLGSAIENLIQRLRERKPIEKAVG